MKRFLLICFMLVGSAAAAIYLFTTPGCACGDILPARVYNLNALNPLRSRAPELAAQEFLRNQGQGVCQPAHSELCEYALRRRPVLDWRLVARQNSSDRVALFYRVKAKDEKDGSEFWGQAEVDVQRVKNDWQVASYGVVY
jgi:hypothetical protein